MSKDIYDLIDTSIKIGLGALIGGVISIVVLQLNYRNSKKKERFNSLNEIADLANTYYYSWERVTSATKGASRESVEKGIEPELFRKKHLEVRDQELYASREGKSKAISKLLLHGLAECANTLESTLTIEKELRDIIIFAEEIPSYSLINEIDNKMLSNKKLFFQKLYEELKRT